MDFTFFKPTASAKELYKALYEAILPAIQQPQECQAIVKRLFMYYFQYDSLDMVLENPLIIKPSQEKILVEVIERLQKHEPIQYILGEAYFLERIFIVNPSVLIPRPETEEMVYQVLKANKKAGLAILDIGTGSGCIAVTLQKMLPQAQVYAIDISQEALQVAQINAQKLDAFVHFIQMDILSQPMPNQRWDLIVSNPPYVRLSEKKWMRPNVLAYEPAKALFVEDARPLLFYENIVGYAASHLKKGGKIYLEINEAFGKEVPSILVEAGFEGVVVKKDLQGKARWVEGVLFSSYKQGEATISC